MKKQLYFLGERACVLACALIGVMTARYIFFFKKGKVR